jgi:hypothetical protein
LIRATWFETPGFAGLLTMRIRYLYRGTTLSDLILRSIAQAMRLEG